jgi:Lon protease-like protein
MDDALDPSSLGAVPLFPLPNVVLFPRAIVPLHIFEERYKTMTADALTGDRLIAIALLQPGWEKDYYQRPPIEPVVGVGRILSHELLADGKYNFLLQGLGRATIVRERCKKVYRVAELQPLAEIEIAEGALAACRRQMLDLLSDRPLSHAPGASQFRDMLASELPTADIADLLAFTYLNDVPLKQSLLADADVRHRVARIVEAIASLRLDFPIPASTPRGFGENPSMN